MAYALNHSNTFSFCSFPIYQQSFIYFVKVCNENMAKDGSSATFN